MIYNFGNNTCRQYLKRKVGADEILIETNDFNENEILKPREFQMKEAVIQGDRMELNMLYEELYKKINDFIREMV